MGRMYLGIEIGGAKLQAVVGDGQGATGLVARTEARAKEGREAILRQVIDLANRAVAEAGKKMASVSVVGVGFGGPVEPRKGIVLKSHQVTGWDDFPLADWLSQELSRPVAVGNDSDLAGWAEARIGAGKNHTPVLYMNIGSGIGGALVLHGELYAGSGIGALEIGHLRILPRPNPDMVASVEPWLDLEEVCSGWAMARRAKAAAKTARAQQQPTLLLELVDGDLDAISTETLVAAVQRKDPLALGIWRESMEWIGLALANAITLLAPKICVLGGGVSLSGETLLTPLRQAVERQVFPPFRGKYQICSAKLGESVVLHGALLLARKNDPKETRTW